MWPVVFIDRAGLREPPGTEGVRHPVKHFSDNYAEQRCDGSMPSLSSSKHMTHRIDYIHNHYSKNSMKIVLGCLSIQFLCKEFGANRDV